MTAQHTPGPWTAELDAHGRGRVKGNGCWVATTWTNADDDSHKRYPAEANARRLVACLNACEGIEDPENVIPQLRRANDLVQQLEPLRIQRDELLEALKGVMNNCLDSDGLAEAYAIARAAIAKATNHET
jgi:hypothetical protein